MKKLEKVRIVIFTKVCFAFMLLFLMSTVQGLTAEGIHLGMITSKPGKIIKRFQPFVDYLKQNGLKMGKIITAKTVAQMAKKFKAGQVDFTFESPYGAVQLMDQAGAIPVLIREKSGIKEYNSVIFVKADSSVKTIADLMGKVIAFEDPTSTSSYILPKSIIENAGLKLVKSRKPVAGSVAYYFSKNDDNTVAQVKKGKTAVAGGIKKSEVEGKPEFRILKPESAYVPRHVMLARKGSKTDRLIDILLKMKDDPKAKSVLKKMKTKTGFSKFNGDPNVIMNTTVRKLLGL